MEAKYMALCAATKESIWLRRVMTDLNNEFKDTIEI